MESVRSRKSALGAGIWLEVWAEHEHVQPDTGLGYLGGVESGSAGFVHVLLRHAAVEQGQHVGVEF